MVEEVLQNLGFENFVKSFREGSKVTIVRRGGNSSDRFLEVAVYAVGGRRGMIAFPEGRDGRGWGRVSGELSKVLVFFGTSVVSSSFSGVPVGKSVGKAAGVLSFAEVVGSPVVGEPLVQKAAAVWCEAEKIFSLDREQEPFRQAVVCYDLERSSFGPLGKGLAVDYYALESSSPSPLGKDLLACSKKRDAVDAVEAAGDVVVQELGIFMTLLDIFEKWLLWACAHRSRLGWVSPDGLKRSMGRTKCCLGLGSMRFRARSRRVGCRSFSKKTRKSGLRRVDYFKKAKKCGLTPVHGFDAGMSSVPSGLGAPAPEVVGFSSASLPKSKERFSPFPPVSSATEILGEKSSTPNVSSSAVTSGSEGVGVSALVRSALGGDPPLSPSSEMAPSPALFVPALSVCSSGADALGERLRYSLPVMLESGVPIYPSESKSVLSYSRKNKVGKLDKHLLAEALETFSAPKELSRPVCGVVSKPLSTRAKSTVAQDEGYQPILRRGFLLPSGAALPPSEVGVVPLSLVQSVLGCPPLMSFSEVGKSSRGRGFEEIGDPPRAAIDLSFCVNTLGVFPQGECEGLCRLHDSN
jgi:hypothetical protein